MQSEKTFDTRKDYSIERFTLASCRKTRYIHFIISLFSYLKKFSVGHEFLFCLQDIFIYLKTFIWEKTIVLINFKNKLNFIF